MAIKVVRWMCSDGSLFVRKKDAEAHDADIAQRKKDLFILCLNKGNYVRSATTGLHKKMLASLIFLIALARTIMIATDICMVFAMSAQSV